MVQRGMRSPPRRPRMPTGRAVLSCRAACRAGLPHSGSRRSPRYRCSVCGTALELERSASGAVSPDAPFRPSGSSGLSCVAPSTGVLCSEPNQALGPPPGTGSSSLGPGPGGDVLGSRRGLAALDEPFVVFAPELVEHGVQQHPGQRLARGELGCRTGRGRARTAQRRGNAPAVPRNPRRPPSSPRPGEPAPVPPARPAEQCRRARPLRPRTPRRRGTQVRRSTRAGWPPFCRRVPIAPRRPRNCRACERPGSGSTSETARLDPAWGSVPAPRTGSRLE